MTWTEAIVNSILVILIGLIVAKTAKVMVHQKIIIRRMELIYVKPIPFKARSPLIKTRRGKTWFRKPLLEC